MAEYIDQMNETIRLVDLPLRIVSLVPSQTELLHNLGLEKEVVGITKFCIHPTIWYQTKNRIGGTKTVDLEKVRALNPDLIIGNKEENSQSDIDSLKEIAPVWMSNVYSLEDAIEMINEIGQIVGKLTEAKQLCENIMSAFSSMINIQSVNKSVLYFIWNNPNLIAGKNTFIDNMLSKCGLDNLATDERYPKVTENLHPDYIFLSSEPFPFKEKHIGEFQFTYPEAEIKIVDGEMFSWYGSRLKDAPNYFTNLLSSLSLK